MLNHELRRDEETLVLRPEGPLDVADFTTLTGHVDAYLGHNGTVMTDALGGF